MERECKIEAWPFLLSLSEALSKNAEINAKFLQGVPLLFCFHTGAFVVVHVVNFSLSSSFEYEKQISLFWIE